MTEYEKNLRARIDSGEEIDWNEISGSRNFKDLSISFITQHEDMLNWNLISEYQTLPESAIEMFIDKVNWTLISGDQKLSEAFIEKYADKLDWGMVSMHQKFSEEFEMKHWEKLYPDTPRPVENINNTPTTEYEKNLQSRINAGEKIDWAEISMSRDFENLSDFFIEKFADKLDWDRISFKQKLSEPFIEKFADRVNWGGVSASQKLSEPFIAKYADKVEWNFISEHQTLSESFIEKYADNLDWRWISIEQKLSESFIEKYAGKVNWSYISEHQTLSEPFVEKYADKVDWREISACQKLSEPFIEKYADRVNWELLSMNQKLSEAFIEKYANKVNWYFISYSQKLSEAFIEKHADKLDWDSISEFQKLSGAFIEKHADKVNWSKISQYQILSESFIENHADKVKWHIISADQKLSEPFIEKYANKVDWEMISRHQTLSEEFKQRHWEQLYPNTPATVLKQETSIEVKNESMTNYEKDLRARIDSNGDIDWSEVSKSENFSMLSTDFLRDYSGELKWKEIAQHQDLPQEIQDEFWPKLHPGTVPIDLSPIESNPFASKIYQEYYDITVAGLKAPNHEFILPLDGFTGRPYKDLSNNVFLTLAYYAKGYETPIYLSPSQINAIRTVTNKDLRPTGEPIDIGIIQEDGSRAHEIVYNLDCTNFKQCFPDTFEELCEWDIKNYQSTSSEEPDVSDDWIKSVPVKSWVLMSSLVGVNQMSSKAMFHDMAEHYEKGLHPKMNCPIGHTKNISEIGLTEKDLCKKVTIATPYDDIANLDTGRYAQVAQLLRSGIYEPVIELRRDWKYKHDEYFHQELNQLILQDTTAKEQTSKESKSTNHLPKMH